MPRGRDVRVFLILLLSGCASLPPCPRPEAMIFETPRGQLVVFTVKNLSVFQERMKGIRDGKCDPEKDPEAI